jgi:hypothetical protein
MTADHRLTEFVVSHDLPEALTPDRHLPPAMCRHDRPAIDKGGNVGNGEAPPTPLGNAREIGRGRIER